MQVRVRAIKSLRKVNKTTKHGSDVKAVQIRPTSNGKKKAETATHELNVDGREAKERLQRLRQMTKTACRGLPLSMHP